MNVMDIMNVLRTDMNMSISHIRIWLCYIYISSVRIVKFKFLAQFSVDYLLHPLVSRLIPFFTDNLLQSFLIL